MVNAAESENRQWLLAAAAAVGAAILAFDVWVELGVAAGVPYVALVCISYFGSRRSYVWSAAAAGVALTLIGYILSDDGSEPWKIYVNRSLAIFAVGITAVFVDLAKRQ